MTWKEIIWNQFGAAIDMLDNAIQACPDELWQEPLYHEQGVDPGFAEFWNIAYHALFWLDFYLSETVEGFVPPSPFTLSEFEAGQLPERVYTKEELRAYLQYGRTKCQTTLETLTDPTTPQRVRPNWRIKSVAELHLYNLRHVQEHAAQLALFLGQRVGSAPGWVGKAQS
ncbi:DinB family protein [Candidatus Leptofilum sp.]|uniref:DinB family protein n=1 Tax=Candidatus Leptofilum sp. TaxID=3241576 RepID=UPI003B5B468F